MLLVRLSSHTYSLVLQADVRSCLEYITYTPYPSGQGAEAPATLFRQRALMLSQFPTAMIARRIEKASVERFSSNAGIGRKGFDWVLETGWKRKLVGAFDS